MPSKALAKFEKHMLVDVDRIIESHNELSPEGPGRRALGHLTRSGVVMACAAWERYLEELVVEAVQAIVQRVDDPKLLPKSVQKEIARVVRDSKHELKPLELAGDGWTSVYLAHAIQLAGNVNTPKSTVIDPLYERLVGISSLSSNWSVGAEAIDAIVGVRGAIAHRGAEADYVSIGQLRQYRSDIYSAVVDTDNAMAELIRAEITGRAPWRRRSPGR